MSLCSPSGISLLVLLQCNTDSRLRWFMKQQSVLKPVLQKRKSIMKIRDEIMDHPEDPCGGVRQRRKESLF